MNINNTKKQTQKVDTKDVLKNAIRSHEDYIINIFKHRITEFATPSVPGDCFGISLN